MNSDGLSIKATKVSHPVCQDYVRSNEREDVEDGIGDIKGLPYVIVADGCSDSPDTDFGARLLVKEAENFRHSSGDWHQNSIAAATAVARGIGLDEQSLDATLLSIRVGAKDDSAGVLTMVDLYGDGMVVFVQNDGTAFAYDIEYTNGYPNYLNYTMNDSRRNALARLTGGNDKKVTRYVRTDGVWGPGSPGVTQSVLDYNKSSFGVKPSQYSLIAVLSDGVHSFARKENGEMKSIPWQTVIDHLLKIASHKGFFVQRQMNSLVRKCEQEGWVRGDDFTMGAVYMGIPAPAQV